MSHSVRLEDKDGTMAEIAVDGEANLARILVRDSDWWDAKQLRRLAAHMAAVASTLDKAI